MTATALLAALLLLLAGAATGAGLALAAQRSRRDAGSPVAERERAALTESLGRVESALREAERGRIAAEAALRAEVAGVRAGSERLGEQAAALVTALRRPQTRGRWGELQLRAVVDAAGMSPRCDFVEQPAVRGPDGLLRPDLVVRLAGGRQVVVDAKVSLAAYLEAHEAADPGHRADRLAAHARALRAHVDALASKAYWTRLAPTPEFVVLFLPGEAFLAPALEADPALLEHAFAHRVHIATPTTLISLLRTVAYSWQQHALVDGAAAVLTLGKELHARLAVLSGHVDKLGRALGGAVTAYNAAVGSYESRVLVSARRLRDLDVVDADLTAPTPLTELPRPVQAADGPDRWEATG